MNTETLMNPTKTVSIVGLAKYLTEKNLERAGYLEISRDFSDLWQEGLASEEPLWWQNQELLLATCLLKGEWDAQIDCKCG